MLLGVLFALLAGLMWGLIFVAPLLVDGYPPALLASGRYLAFGLIVLPLAWRARKRLAALSASDWREALALTLVGNLIYYFCLSGAILRIGSPLAAMIIGTLPVVTALAANRLYGELDGRLSRTRLYPALLLMGAVGLFCSWLGTLCWNEASQRLPTVLVGPLIVFETLAGLLYAFMLRGAMPPMSTLIGVVCLVAGVLYVLAGKPKPQPEKRAKARLT